MSDKQPVPLAASMSFGDVLFAVFRHKSIIAAILCLDVIVVMMMPRVFKPRYESEAKLLIKYVMETKSPPQVGANQAAVQPVDDSGQGVMNTELEILTSADLALQVADAVGPEKILAKLGGGTNRDIAAGIIQDPKNLVAEAPKKSNVIRIAFQHPDPAIAQAVLKELIDAYIKRHLEVHRGGGFDEFLTQQTDQLHSRLLTTEEELRKAKSKLGIVSLEQAKKNCADQIALLQQKIFDAQAELAEREAAGKQILDFQHLESSPGTNVSVESEVVAIPPEKVTEYNKVCGLIENLEKKELDLLVYFTPSNSLVSEVHQQLLRNRELKNRLEKEAPGLKAIPLTTPKTVANGTASPARPDPVLAMSEIAGLRSKIQVLTNRLVEVQRRAAALDEAESSISELERRKGLEEGYYTNFSESLEQAHINDQMGAGKVSNINVIQTPSTASKLASKLRKMMVMVLFGGMAGAVGLALVIEFILDQSIKRPADVEARLGLPLLITVPKLPVNGEFSKLTAGNRPRLLPGQTAGKAFQEGHPGDAGPQAGPDSGVGPIDSTGAAVTKGQGPRGLRPFSEALRDRLITYFELKNLTHKPKLVAVTGCAEGAGVSTIAAGLAASLSETGDGNVLLVDMNLQNGATHHFHKGDIAHGLDDALEKEKRDSALVQDKLYVVSEGTSDANLPSVLPKRFKNLVPRLKASDYDYIIFDMPPVSQISLTPRLARFMDMVLMVVESGKTDREIARKAASLMTESKANVAIVLNKNRKFVPRKLQQEL